jgi:hypothetical protein
MFIYNWSMDVITGNIVEVTNKKSKHYGDMGVIMYETDKMYGIMSLTKIPIPERFIFNGDVLIGTKYKYYEYVVSKKSVDIKQIKKTINMVSIWRDAAKLLKNNVGLTRNQINNKYK